MRKLIMFAIAVMALAIPAAASADSYSTGFENPPFTGSAFPGTDVNNQDGWEMTQINGVVYDEGVVQPGITGISGDQALRQSNAVATGDFAGQTHSPQVPNAASENGPNHVFDATYKFKSATGAEQQGLAVSVSPDDGIGGRMAYVRMQDEADGIHVFVVDNPADANQRSTESPHVLSYTGTHTVRFLMELKAGTNADGSANDVVRVIVDGEDIGDLTHTCFTSWENWFRHGENREPPVTNSLIVMARGASVPSVAGGGYLIDDVSYETRDANGPKATDCSTKKAAFCSPGYWKNASDAAWALTGVSRNAVFNGAVSPAFYANDISPAGTTLTQVLNAKSANTYGKAAGPFGLNPFNAVGAYLTSKLAGYEFTSGAYAQSQAGIDTCPLDNKGNVKPAPVVTG
jgi:hypothetical protein